MAVDKDVIRERLKEAINGDSQQAVADKLNLAQSTISKFLNGKQDITLETMYHIAKIYGVSVDWILGLTDSKDGKDTAITEPSTYADLIKSISELVYVGGAEITNDVDGLVVKINDPLAKSLLIKSSTFMKTDADVHRSWLIKMLSMFKDREIIEKMFWEFKQLQVLTKNNLSEVGWLQVHDKARDYKDQYWNGFDTFDPLF